MRRILLFILLSLLFRIASEAIPVRRYLELLQTDGSRLSVLLVGDEYFHYHITDDAIPVVQANDENWYYASIKENKLVSSGLLAHNKYQRNKKEKKYIEENYTPDYINNFYKTINKIGRIYKAELNKNRKTQSGIKSDFIGKKRGLVILVNFANKSFTSNNIQYDYYRMFNEEGYSDNNHIGSVHDYFYDQSYGKFDLSFDVVGPVTLTNNYSFYGGNNMAGNDKNPHIMVREACAMVDEQIDFSQYDWDKDGEVDQVFIVYAGYGEATGGPSSTIWPHKSNLQYSKEGTLSLDGVIINQYACTNELDGNSGTVKRGIGTACHEFSHCLGLPDAYDTDYSGAFGMNGYDLMDSGGHSGPNKLGEVPYGYSAFERWYVGWLNIKDLTKDVRIQNMCSINFLPVAYKICNERCPDEYFVIENHNNKGWFSYIGNKIAPHGMMVTHIDYNDDAWRRNQVNPNSTHQRMSIIPADNSYGEYISSIRNYYLSDEEIAGDLFPGLQNVKRLSSISHKETGGLLFNENVDDSYHMRMVIDNIVESNYVVSFSVGHIETPTRLNAVFEGEDINITWEPSFGAELYSLEIVKIISLIPTKIENVLYEDIEGSNFTIKDFDCLQCNVRVKAKNEFATSDWSEFVKFTNDTDGINDIEKDNSIHREYYNINGTEAIMPKTKGIYIQKENNQTKKIYIR